MNRLQLSQLRPGQPVEALRQALGSAWREPRHQDEGHVLRHEFQNGFCARLDVSRCIGKVSFFGRFPSKYVIEGLHLGMPQPQALAVHSGWVVCASESDADRGISAFRCDLPSGLRLTTRFARDSLIGLDLELPDREYPRADVWAPAPAGKYPLPDAEPGLPFADPNLKLVVLNELVQAGVVDLGNADELAMHVLQRCVNLEAEGAQLIPEIYDYLLRYPLSEEQLARVQSLCFDGGLDIYFLIWPRWDGETDEFSVRSLSGIERCPNLRKLSENALTEKLDLRPLQGLKQLQELELAGRHDHGEVLLELPALGAFRCFEGDVDPELLDALRAKGVAVKLYS